MAAYPSIPIDNSTQISADGGISVDRAEDGTIRGRVSYAETVYTMKLVHTLLTSTQRDTLMTFYDTNKALSWTFTYDSDTYTLRFMGAPQHQHLSGGWWNVTVSAIGTKA